MLLLRVVAACCCCVLLLRVLRAQQYAGMSPTIPLTTLTTPPTTTYHPPHTTIYHHHHHHHIIPYYSYHPNTTVINHGTTIHALAQSQHSNAPHHIILRLSIRFTRFHLMRVTIKWYSVVITILLVAQSTLLLVLLQPKHDLGGASHSLLPSPPQTPSPKSSCPTIVERLPCEPQTRYNPRFHLSPLITDIK